MKQLNSVKYFDDLPDYAFVRLPVVKALYACSSTSVWRGVKSGRIPAPHKISANTTGWNVGELRSALVQLLVKEGELGDG